MDMVASRYQVHACLERANKVPKPRWVGSPESVCPIVPTIQAVGMTAVLTTDSTISITNSN